MDYAIFWDSFAKFFILFFFCISCLFTAYTGYIVYGKVLHHPSLIWLKGCSLKSGTLLQHRKTFYTKFHHLMRWDIMLIIIWKSFCKLLELDHINERKWYVWCILSLKLSWYVISCIWASVYWFTEEMLNSESPRRFLLVYFLLSPHLISITEFCTQSTFLLAT